MAEWSWVIACAFLVVVTPDCLADEKVTPPLPVGWREVRQSEFSESWRSANENRYFKVEGDFNGDGKLDVAKMLISGSGRKFGLFVFVAQEDGHYRQVLLDSGDYKELNRLGIGKVSPGSYKTACGKGYWRCGKSEPSELKAGNIAIDFFIAESANSYFVWSESRNGFMRIWMSD